MTAPFFLPGLGLSGSATCRSLLPEFDQFRNFFVDFPPMADCKNANQSARPVHGIHHAKSSGPVLPVTFQFPQKLLALFRIFGNGLKGGLEALPDIGVEMTDPVSDVWRDIELKAHHSFAATLLDWRHRLAEHILERQALLACRIEGSAALDLPQ